jgi:hypothetical protein
MLTRDNFFLVFLRWPRVTKDIVSDQAIKLSEQTPLRLSESVSDRVKAAAKRHGIKRPEWIRRAIIAELERDEAASARGAITPEERELLDACVAAQRRGVDPKQALADALEAKTVAEAGAVAGAEAGAVAAA